MRKERFIIVSVSILVILIGISSLASAVEDLASLVPQEAMIVVFIASSKDDAGVSYISRMLKERESYADRPQKKNAINNIYRNMNEVDVVGIIFPGEYIPQYIFIVKIKDSSQIEIFRKATEELIRKQEELEKASYMDYEIIYAIDRYPRDPSAYTLVDNILIIGSNVNILEKIISYRERGNIDLLTGDDKFIDIKSRSIGDWDGFIYINNKDGMFTKALRKWEKDYHMTLLMSAELLDAAGISFDIVDEKSMRGQIIFVARENISSFKDIYDDVRFFDEVIKRKFIAEEVEYSSDIKEEAGYVTLDFEINKTKPFWTKVFGKESKQIFRGEDVVISKEVEKSVTTQRTIAIFVLVAIAIFVIAKRKKV